jgi:hypothetical protein
MGTETHTHIITVHKASYNILTDQCVRYVKSKEIATRDDRVRGRTKWGVSGLTWRLRREKWAPLRNCQGREVDEREGYEVWGVRGGARLWRRL